ncbi:aminotransferase family protein [Thermobifida cellulosilytica]|uniref:Uncharacterized protein n=1 Tax=Thermobifida cellulosilytica TB100 TaxID=665004 RepID=A0A147KKI6_THECS|nr:aminotransferase class III-fold pyridoxal phosphate-dependent enzyme [Thermobifida cellulosilytica]KUP97753.1 hypothetical protein AC529_04635 [Thermobifida cellulosilytica TB100]
MIDPGSFKLWNSTAMAAHLSYLDPDELIVEGEGVRVRDAGGRWFLDARSGFWNVTLGYRHPALVAAVREQVERLSYGSMWGYGRPTGIAVECAAALASRLPEGIEHIRFQSNGAQAVETAALLSRHVRLLEGQPHKNTVVSMWGGFHGFGPGASALTGLPYLHYHAGPLLPEVIHVPGPHAPGGEEAFASILGDYGPERISAVVVEPVIGEGGHVLGRDYLHRLAAFCREHDIHLVVDEVTTGMGRVGAYTRCEQLGLTPDLLLLGKGLTSGYAGVSAVCLSERIYRTLYDAPLERFFAAGSTHDGHPVALGAALAVLDVLADGEVFANVAEQGKRLHTGLQEIAARHPSVTAVRGTGLMYAVEFAEAAAQDPWFVNKVRLAAEDRGVLVAVLNAVPALMVIPPLVVEQGDVDEICAALDGALSALADGWSPPDPAKGFV